MTTISSASSSLSSIAALYAQEDSTSSTTSSSTSSSGTTAGLTSDQVANLVGIAEKGATTATNTIGTLLGQSTTSSDDLSSIIDAIQAQTDSGVASTTGGKTTTTTAVTDQQKAVAVMQSLYQTQQANLFTLLG